MHFDLYVRTAYMVNHLSRTTVVMIILKSLYVRTNV